MSSEAEHDSTMTKNLCGQWVRDVPLPRYGLRKHCWCRRKFWTEEGYRGHYALSHILILPSRPGSR